METEGTGRRVLGWLAEVVGSVVSLVLMAGLFAVIVFLGRWMYLTFA